MESRVKGSTSEKSWNAVSPEQAIYDGNPLLSDADASLVKLMKKGSTEARRGTILCADDDVKEERKKLFWQWECFPIYHFPCPLSALGLTLRCHQMST